MCQASSDGVPSTIHSATSWPRPPAPARPWAQKPAAVQRPRTSVGPRMNSPSGVKRLRAVDQLDDLGSSSDGTRTIAFSISSSNRGQSSARSLPLKSAGIPSSDQGAGFALVAAHDQPARLGTEVDEQRRVAHRRHVGREPVGFVIRYSCAIGTIGTFTPASAPISFANIPPALTTTSASIGPWSVTTPVTRAALDGDLRDTRVLVDLGAAAAGAFGERERELRGVDVAVGREVGRADARRRSSSGGKRLLRLLGRDQLERKAEGLRPARLAGELLHPLRATRRAAASRPRASRSRGRPRRRACGRARPRSSSSSSGSASSGAGRRARRSGTSSRSSARRGRPARRRDQPSRVSQ